MRRLRPAAPAHRSPQPPPCGRVRRAPELADDARHPSGSPAPERARRAGRSRFVKPAAADAAVSTRMSAPCAQHVDDAHAGRVQPDAADHHLRAGESRGRHHPERRRRQVTRDLEALCRSRCPPATTPRAPLRGPPRRRSSARSVVAGGGGSWTVVTPGVKPGSSTALLTWRSALRARTRSPELAGAMDRQWRPPSLESTTAPSVEEAG